MTPDNQVTSERGKVDTFGRLVGCSDMGSVVLLGGGAGGVAQQPSPRVEK